MNKEMFKDLLSVSSMSAEESVNKMRLMISCQPDLKYQLAELIKERPWYDPDNTEAFNQWKAAHERSVMALKEKKIAERKAYLKKHPHALDEFDGEDPDEINMESESWVDENGEVQYFDDWASP